MKRDNLPKYWYILNVYKDVREFLVEKYKIPDIINWHYEYIGYDGDSCNKGVHGCKKKDMYHKAVEISYNQFIEYTKDIVINSYEIY